MSIDLGGPGGVPQGSPQQGPSFAGGGTARAAAEWIQGAAVGINAALPAALRGVPGDPSVARHVGAAAAAALFVVALMGPLGVFQVESSAVGHLADLQQTILAGLAFVLEADLPQTAAIREAALGQARILGSPQGVAGLHGVLGAFALAQGSAMFIIAGLMAFVACALQLLVWHARFVAAGDNTGLIAGEHMPHLQEDARNMDVIMQHC
mmetsp:Transcript_94315/g.236792  ORF Transcript_94315/g.236792 Transcript_94315/m.236792 type:complete len:209 (-) Transcript_94315:162-788(-)|eukprot:CAMPEP_0115616742 /NCGR_PEP_ID=MMETSP0272-20121206/23294_1 /TAXON_ID=71861 /ORGANISM="Scrippsiella trochoidea, Strain CCMP3099" /LENGTH=208 /DNA_ID=CAMNT_0003052693 /DNA_START=69 /DNA_END=695 /DNA_ORIENTATION=-